MKLIVCLGNPGVKYVNTRHNIGFKLGETLIERFCLTRIGEKWKSIIYEGGIGEEKIKVIFPQTFMNLSGETVQAVASFYKMAFSDVMVVCDDFELPFGVLRMRQKGSAGTHNGLKSIIAVCGRSDFVRLRMGVGLKPGRQDAAAFVLGNFSTDEMAQLGAFCEGAGQALETAVVEGVEKAMSVFNGDCL